MRKKSNTNFVAEQPRQGWAYFEESNQWRRTPHPWGAPGDHFPREYGDWVAVSRPKGWQPPTGALGGTLAGESLLDGGANLLAAGSGGHMKIGAGHKPQGYDEHGRYTGPQGGSIPTGGGSVRLYADDADEKPDEEESTGEDTGAEPEEATEEVSQELEGVLVADSGQIESDAGGGLSGGTEVRGPVTPPQAEVTWKNDDPNKPDPKPDDVKPQTRETVENLRTNNPALDSISVNSGKRDGDPNKDPHADGRAVDINKVNGIPVKDLGKAQGEEGERARKAAKNMEEQAKNNPNVNQVIGPDGGWKRNGDRWDPITDAKLLNGHKDHYHINVFRK